MAWYIARSLDVLLGQLNNMAPRRNKASDGGIGDPAHSARTSDHNPISGTGQVCARDYTHDPAGGLDCNWLANVLVTSRDPRIKYIIWNRRILDSRPGNNPWVWMPYYGENPHTKHLHLSVKAGATGDNQAQWNLGGQGARDMELSDQVTLFDGTKASLNNVLAGILARLGKQQSKEYPHVYADTPEFVTAIDQNVIHIQRETERIDDVEVKVDAAINSLNLLHQKINQLLEGK